MALNEIYAEADNLDYVVPSGTISGNFVVLGGTNASANATGIVGVAQTTARAGLDGSTLYATLSHKGVFTATTADTAAIAVGAPLYIDNANAIGEGQRITATSTGNKFVGYAVRSKGATTGTQTIYVRINN
jgi:predicted RecA/RadA family phage recombinase